VERFIVTSSGIQASIPFHLFCHPSPPCSFIFYHCHYYNDDGDDDDDDDDDDDVNPW